MNLHFLMVGFLLLALMVSGQKKRIVSGAIWYDDAGKRIQAHGGCLLQVCCYRSNDLLTWTRLPNVLTGTAGTPLNESMVVERPRVLFNQVTNKFVMYFHYDVSLCDIFDGNANLKLARLSEDYVSGSSPKSLLDKTKGLYLEEGVLGSDWSHQGRRCLPHDIFTAGNYFPDIEKTLETDGNAGWGFLDILKKGWSANPNKVMKANNLAGPWSKETDIADPKLNTYSSQNTHDLTISGTQDTTHICGTYRTGEMSINGGKKFNVYYPPTSAQISIPVRVHLKPEGENSIDMFIPSGVKVNHIIIY
ncbi:family 43 glycoside hydrolase [Melampsora americana]|nr:family 43 glycoside hydrolase [Melampsora americana]